MQNSIPYMPQYRVTSKLDRKAAGQIWRSSSSSSSSSVSYKDPTILNGTAEPPAAGLEAGKLAVLD
jgi:hypothetical protein